MTDTSFSKLEEQIAFLSKYKDDHRVIAFDRTTADETAELADMFSKSTDRKILLVTYSHVSEVIKETREKLGEVAPFDLFLKTFTEKYVIFISEFDNFKGCSKEDKDFFYTLLLFNMDALIVLTGIDIDAAAKELLKNI